MPVDFLLVTSSEAICKRAAYIPVVCNVLSGGPANDEESGRETSEFEIMSVMSDNSWAARACGSTPVAIISLVNLMVFTLSPEMAVVIKSISLSCEMRPTCKQKNIETGQLMLVCLGSMKKREKGEIKERYWMIKKPRTSCWTMEVVIFVPNKRSWSKTFSASLKDPSALVIINFSASPSNAILS